MSSIDVVIPCYRYGRYLRECVESVLAQDVDNLRVLIIDDESPDETPEVAAALVRQDSRVTYRRHAKNRGHISTYNEGIEWTSAEYMLLLSADDLLLPMALKRAVTLMNRHPEVGLTFGDAVILTDDGASRPFQVNLRRAGFGSSTVLSGAEFIDLCGQDGSTNIVPTPTAVVRTDLLKRLGGYKPELPHSADFELWLRLAAHSQVGFIRAAQAVYRRHTNNMSLGYVHENVLLDLEQRKAALTLFVGSCRDDIPDARAMQTRLLSSLGRDAVKHASHAFNDNRMELSRRICEFALTVYPGARRTLSWKTLVVKRLLGFRLSSMLLPAALMLRQLTLRVRG